MVSVSKEGLDVLSLAMTTLECPVAVLGPKIIMKLGKPSTAVPW